MAVHDYLEDLSSLLPAITLLNKLGYEYLTPSENLALRGGRTSKLILENVALVHQLGNPDGEALASRDRKLELPVPNSQAEAWELAQTDVLFCKLPGRSLRRLLVSKLGKPVGKALAPRNRKLALPLPNSLAGDWELAQRDSFMRDFMELGYAVA